MLPKRPDIHPFLQFAVSGVAKCFCPYFFSDFVSFVFLSNDRNTPVFYEFTQDFIWQHVEVVPPSFLRVIIFFITECLKTGANLGCEASGYACDISEQILRFFEADLIVRKFICDSLQNAHFGFLVIAGVVVSTAQDNQSQNNLGSRLDPASADKVVVQNQASQCLGIITDSIFRLEQQFELSARSSEPVCS
jgi:hypothetical protein